MAITEKKTRYFEVTLKQGFPMPMVGGKLVHGGLIYRRGGLSFTQESDKHIIEEQIDFDPFEKKQTVEKRIRISRFDPQTNTDIFENKTVLDYEWPNIERVQKECKTLNKFIFTESHPTIVGREWKHYDQRLNFREVSKDHAEIQMA